MIIKPSTSKSCANKVPHDLLWFRLGLGFADVYVWMQVSNWPTHHIIYDGYEWHPLINHRQASVPTWHTLAPMSLTTWFYNIMWHLKKCWQMWTVSKVQVRWIYWNETYTHFQLMSGPELGLRMQNSSSCELSWILRIWRKQLDKAS